MITRLFYGLILLAVFAACSEDAPLKIEVETISDANLEICKDSSCPDIEVNLIKVSGNGDASEKINNAIEEFAKSALYIGEAEEVPQMPGISEAAEAFIKVYRTHSAEFPDMQAEYFADINVRDIFNGIHLISLQMQQYLFTGGAHGYGAVWFSNFDPQTGEILTSEDIFNDVAAFKAIAEERFRKEFEIPENESINSTGFWFEDEVFYLPEDIGFTEKVAILRYNQYDIASYAAGPIELEIPIKEIKSLLAIPLE